MSMGQVITDALSSSFIIYPAFVTFLIASLKCPLGYGKFFAGGVSVTVNQSYYGSTPMLVPLVDAPRSLGQPVQQLFVERSWRQ